MFSITGLACQGIIDFMRNNDNIFVLLTLLFIFLELSCSPTSHLTIPVFSLI